MKKYILIQIIILNTLFAFSQQNIKYSKSTNNITPKAYHSDSLDVINYDINLNITDFTNKIISGYTLLKIVPKVNNLTNIPLDLQQLTIDSIFVDSIKTTSFNYNDTLINIAVLPYNVTDTILVKIYYHGTPQIDPSSWGGFYFQGDYAYNLGVGFDSNPHNYGRVWFPCVDDFVDRATYDYRITVKNGYFAVCNGTLIDTTYNGNNTHTFYWRLHNTIPTYLSSVAVSRYVAVTDTFNGLTGQIPIEIYVPENDSLNAVNSFINLKNVLTGFENDFGPYRWERVGYVAVPFSSGAMEHATNIAYPLAVINGSLSYEYLYAHELSHHWFGDLVTCKTAEDMWLNEGWASYCEAIFNENIYGKEAYKNYSRNNHKNVLLTTHITDNGYRAVYGIPSEYTYGSTVYDKGADVAKTIRGYLGDSLFFETIKAYLDTFAYKPASSFDFRDFISSYTGIDMTDFFDTWVFSPGFVHFSLDSFNVVNNAGNYDVTVYMKQKLKEINSFANSNRIPITFADDNWNFYNSVVKFSGETGSQIFTLPFNPKHIFVDKEEQIQDATTDRYFIISNAGDYNFDNEYAYVTINNLDDSCMLRVVHNWVAPDSLKTPIPGLFLSDNRYYNVEGILPSNFSASIKFKFTKSLNEKLDNNLLTNVSDSLVLLYRKSPKYDWQIIPFIKTGSNTAGYLFDDSLKLGQYCMGIWDWDRYVSINKTKDKSNNYLKIYPNPSKNYFKINFSLKNKGKIKIYNINGDVVYEKNIDKTGKSITWSPNNLSKGVYIVKLNTDKITLSSKKIVYN